MRVICINDKGRPADFTGDWVEKDEVYEVIAATNLANYGIPGFKLKGMRLDPPYEYYLSTRFRPYTQEDMEAEEAVKKLLEEIQEEQWLELTV